MRDENFSRVELLRHALGADSPTPGYRNYFAAEVGSADDDAWTTMVVEGLAFVARESDDFAPLLNIYAATTAGRRLAGLP